MYALSTLPKKRTTPPLIEPSSGQYSPVWRATEYDLGHSSIPRWHAIMRAARRQGVLEVVCCGTRSSSRVHAYASPVQHLLRGGYRRGLHTFQGGRRHHGRFGTPEEEKGAGGARGEITAGKSVLATPLWGMLYADDTGVVSRSPEQLRKMVEMIVVVYARRLASPYRRPRLRSCAYARRGCRSPPPHSA